jgi:hypothetical protein
MCARCRACDGALNCICDARGTRFAAVPDWPDAEPRLLRAVLQPRRAADAAGDAVRARVGSHRGRQLQHSHGTHAPRGTHKHALTPRVRLTRHAHVRPSRSASCTTSHAAAPTARRTPPLLHWTTTGTAASATAA